MTIKKWILSLVLVIAGGSSVTGVLLGSSNPLPVAMITPPATSTTSLWSCDWKKTCAIGMVAVTGVGILGRMFISWNNLKQCEQNPFDYIRCEMSFCGTIDPLTKLLYDALDPAAKNLKNYNFMVKNEIVKELDKAYSDKSNLDGPFLKKCSQYCKTLTDENQTFFVRLLIKMFPATYDEEALKEALLKEVDNNNGGDGNQRGRSKVLDSSNDRDIHENTSNGNNLKFSRVRSKEGSRLDKIKVKKTTKKSCGLEKNNDNGSDGNQRGRSEVLGSGNDRDIHKKTSNSNDMKGDGFSQVRSKEGSRLDKIKVKEATKKNRWKREEGCCGGVFIRSTIVNKSVVVGGKSEKLWWRHEVRFHVNETIKSSGSVFIKDITIPCEPGGIKDFVKSNKAAKMFFMLVEDFCEYGIVHEKKVSLGGVSLDEAFLKRIGDKLEEEQLFKNSHVSSDKIEYQKRLFFLLLQQNMHIVSDRAVGSNFLDNLLQQFYQKMYFSNDMNKNSNRYFNLLDQLTLIKMASEKKNIVKIVRKESKVEPGDLLLR
ncbi:MAG: hypothetical protein WBQ73_01750 [Candidatus Babeliales bacterium]